MRSMQERASVFGLRRAMVETADNVLWKHFDLVNALASVPPTRCGGPSRRVRRLSSTNAVMSESSLVPMRMPR
jgi:hypothetical protein